MYKTYVECSKCGQEYQLNEILSLCEKCGGALLFRYDLAKIAEKMSVDELKKREDTFWKFIEILPVSPKNIVSIGEPYTPILKLPKDFNEPFVNLYVKDDGRLPTETFKARGMAVAVSKLRELGSETNRYSVRW